jgi:phage major head subunit gpT-like protein
MVHKMKTIQLPQQTRFAEFRASSYDEDRRTVTVVASTGSRGPRYNFFEGRYYEELLISEDSVVLDRFNNGAPVLNAHGMEGDGLDQIMGVVERGWVENGQLMAEVRFSEREEVEKYVADIRSGIIRNVSIGYRILEAIEIMEEGVEDRIIRVTKFEPMELSFVQVGFDPKAQTRSSAKLFDCDFQHIERSQPEMEDNKTQEPQVNVDEIKDAARSEAIEQERKRVAGIHNCVRKAGLSMDLASQMIEAGRSIADAHEIVLDELAKRDEQMKTESQTTSVEVGEDLDKANRKAGVVNSLMIKGLGESKTRKMDDNTRRFMGMRLVDVARMCIDSNDFMTPRETFKRALHSTSDFPAILEDTINKSLRQEYAEAPQTFAPITRVVTANDFREISRTQLGDVSSLEEVGEGSEYKYGTVADAAEKYSVTKYGKVLALTYEAMVNDDLDAFTRLPQKLGRRARDLESDKIWAIITGNPAMADGFNLFSADHSNTQSAAAISIDTLAGMRAAMRLQRGLAPKAGEEGSLINLMPSYLIVPAALETAGEKLISTNLLADAQGNINPFAGRLQLIVEPRLDAASQTAHFLAADTAQLDILELARLADEQGPVIETQDGFDVDGMKVKIRHVFGVKAIDYRGLQRNPGA